MASDMLKVLCKWAKNVFLKVSKIITPLSRVFPDSVCSYLYPPFKGNRLKNMKKLFRSSKLKVLPRCLLTTRDSMISSLLIYPFPLKSKEA